MKRNIKHDISGGIDFTGGQLETIKVIFYSVLGWFTITIEAFLRYDFGERYYTKGNFFVGYSLLTWVTFFGGLFAAYSGSFSGWITFLWIGYIGLSIFHFWKIWVNNQIGTPQHSIYGGYSRLEPLGRILMKVLNPMLAGVARILGNLTLKKEKANLLDKSLKYVPVIRDSDAFTKKWVEPVTVFLLAVFVMSIGQVLLGMWLYVCSIALLVHTHIGYDNTRDQELNMSDSIINVAFAKDDKQGEEIFRMQMREALEKVEKRAKTEPEFVEGLKEKNPSVLDALADLNPNLKNLGKNKGGETTFN
jgi:hypothetical protein